MLILSLHLFTSPLDRLQVNHCLVLVHSSASGEKALPSFLLLGAKRERRETLCAIDTFNTDVAHLLSISLDCTKHSDTVCKTHIGILVH